MSSQTRTAESAAKTARLTRDQRRDQAKDGIAPGQYLDSGDRRRKLERQGLYFGPNHKYCGPEATEVAETILFRWRPGEEGAEQHLLDLLSAVLRRNVS